MKKKEIILHVGYPKTGTTTIQKHLYPIINEIQYLGKHINQGALFDFEDSVLEQMLFENEENIDFSASRKKIDLSIKKDKIVISQERLIFSSLRIYNVAGKEVTPDPLQVAKKLRRLFNEESYNVSILFTVRRQDQILRSIYAQGYSETFVNSKQFDTFKKYLNLFSNDQNTEHKFCVTLNYNRIISAYKSLFGSDKVFVLIFEELQENPNDFYRKLSKILDVNFEEYSKSVINKHENNRSVDKTDHKITMDMTLLDKLIIFKNKNLGFLNITPGPKIKSILKNIVLRNERINKSIVLSEQEKKLVLSSYSESNKILSDEMGLNLKKYGYF